MKRHVLFLTVLMSLFAAALIFSACEESKNGSRSCVSDTDCLENQVCGSDGYCAYPKCIEMGGTCTPQGDDCPAGTPLSWANLECPGGRAAQCCLPNTSCSALGGLCYSMDSSCPMYYGAYVGMDCPGGDSTQCCIPTQ